MFESAEAARLAAARNGDQHAFGSLIEPYQRELQVHCYRLLGSLQDAEDLVQETLLRAWRRIDSFEGRASFRAWLYKIATNACFDALDTRRRRALPHTASQAAGPGEPMAAPLDQQFWLEPFPDALLDESATSPESRYDAHESISLAFLVALQMLPPRQRAVLILRDVLGWHAGEVAGLLDLTIPSVNSALHRARTTLAQYYHLHNLEGMKIPPDDERTRALLDRYVQAWDTADVAGLIALLKEDATFSMPPLPAWYRGQEAIAAFLASTIFGGPALGRGRLRPTRANARPAFALYQLDDTGGMYRGLAIQVLTIDRERLAEITIFINPRLFARFGLPAELDV